jgi:sodium-type flagellar protein MotY
MSFTFELAQGPARGGVARLLARPAPWRSELLHRDHGDVELRAGRQPFQPTTAQVETMLLDLRDGYFPVLRYRDWHGEERIREVALTMINSREALQKFDECVARILPHSWAQIKESRFYYPLDKADLTDAIRARLAAIVDYMSVDKRVQWMMIEGFTDHRGFRYYNDRLSRQRAENVRNHLLKLGITEEQIRLKAWGERKPLATNRTRQGQAKNRAVIITLSQDPPPPPPDELDEEIADLLDDQALFPRY